MSSITDSPNKRQCIDDQYNKTENKGYTYYSTISTPTMLLFMYIHTNKHCYL